MQLEGTCSLAILVMEYENIVIRRITVGYYFTADVASMLLQCRLCAGSGALTIRISDQGGGIPVNHMTDVWSYGYTTITDGTPGVEQDSRSTSNSGSSSSSTGA